MLGGWVVAMPRYATRSRNAVQVTADAAALVPWLPTWRRRSDADSAQGSDRPANRMFKYGTQPCPIDYMFMHGSNFDKINQFWIGEEGSDQYPLKLELSRGAQSFKEGFFTITIDYPKYLPTRFLEESLAALAFFQQEIMLSMAPANNIKWFENILNQVVACLKVVLKGKKGQKYRGKSSQEREVPGLMRNVGN
ncbi:hypothetical protein NDU88_006623 [Pleurodeles waltl]|uniref:Uncharacterized protein n=1 Tax=Pleurodeles waltl TaxID=8319 RepID=A0AAV7LXF1_PLEWA|nr:hypothetical protein NDU88_006623 [Pleurodeles waltl]